MRGTPGDRSLQPDGDRSIIALIPAYNEAGHVAVVVEGAHRHLPVLVVDDGSTDDTAARAAAAGAQVFPQYPNQGKGAALRAGFHRAMEMGAEAVITLDADGQHDPAEIPKFLQAFTTRKADLIIGARDFSQMPLIRRFANTIGRLSFSWAMRQPIRDNQSGYRLLNRRMMTAVLESREGGFEFEVEMIVTCLLGGFSLEWVPIRTIYTGQGSHIQPWHHTVQFFRLVRQTRRLTRS